ncbi:hypothetical protein Tco_1360712 [Tanacetum coccineum]
MPPLNNWKHLTESYSLLFKIQFCNSKSEPNVAPVVTPVPKASIPFPSRRNDERRKEKANDQIEKFYEIFRDLNLKDEEKAALLKVLKSHKRAIAWKLSVLKGVNTEILYSQNSYGRGTMNICAKSEKDPQLNPKDQEKTTFTLPIRNMCLYRDMPFGAMHAHGTSSKDTLSLRANLFRKDVEAGVKDTNLSLNWKRAISCPLGKKNSISNLYHYASKTMNEAQTLTLLLDKNYLYVVYLWKFRYILSCPKHSVILTISAIIYIFARRMLSKDLMRWILLLQEFDIEIRDKKGAENLAADHLSRLGKSNQDKSRTKEINEACPLETLGSIVFKIKICADQVIRRCVYGQEALDHSQSLPQVDLWGTLWCHLPSKKIFDSGLYWPTIYKDAP